MSEDVRDRPRFDEEDARGLANELYGITAVAHELPSERDQNFLLRSPSGDQFVLKLANSSVRCDILDLQNKAMRYIAERKGSVACPRVCRTLTGEEITPVKGKDGRRHLLRLLTLVPGIAFAKVKPHTPELLRSLGHALGEISKSLQGFSHQAAKRELNWDLKNASSLVRAYKNLISEATKRGLVEQFLSHYESTVLSQVSSLRTSVIHGDANDFNVLVNENANSDRRVVGLIDFGDMVHSCTIHELAIGVAYAMLGKLDPLAAAASVVRGYHEVFPLIELEIDLLYDLACMRLCTSVAMCAHQQKLEPHNEYLSISERPAWELLQWLADVHPHLAQYTFRNACGLPPCPKTTYVIDWLKANRDRFDPVVTPDLKSAKTCTFDLSVGSPQFAMLRIDADVDEVSAELFRQLKAVGAKVGIGRYGEARRCYTSDLFRAAGNDNDGWRTIHLGIDLFLEAGSAIFAPLGGRIHSFQDNQGPLDYGPTIILEHDMDERRGKFFTLYGHLSRQSLDGLGAGKLIKRGDQIGTVGDSSVNGGWPPHLHFQLISDLLGKEGDFPGVATASDRDVWLSICPDPNFILGIAEEGRGDSALSPNAILQLRDRHLGKSLSVSYKRPLKIVRGSMQYLFDETGRAYLDAVNNVCHVGHCHPRVVEAAQRQLAVLNTNTRYLHENIVRYAKRLAATFPDPLRVCFLVCSGSEAMDLALRLARTYTKQKDVIVVEGAYHGNLTSLIEISPYKFDGPGGVGAPSYVHKVVMPDGYRGPYQAADPEAGRKYAEHVGEAIRQAHDRETSVAAFVCESLLGCGGQIALPEGYLKEAYQLVRDAGGVCIADEVQVGFGRVGTHFWGFETQGVVPDIVALGKPIGNGHPMAAVVTTPEIANAFANGMEYFNTFGGNPVSCAVGLAVLDVMEDERLQENALHVGEHLKSRLEQLKAKYPVIGDVRGAGLFLGIEFVLDRQLLTPAADIACYVVERMKSRGVLLSTDGPMHNVIKIKPPLVFTKENADFLVSRLDEVLSEDAVRCFPGITP